MNAQILRPGHVHANGEIVYLTSYSVMLTEDHNLVLRGPCPKCGTMTDCVTPLEEAWRSCPPPDEPKAHWTVKDIADLKLMKILLPDTPA